LTALVVANLRRSCENCRTVLIPIGAEQCWACGGPSKQLEIARTDGNSRTLEIITLGAGIGGGLVYVISESELATAIGALVGAAVFGLGAMIRLGIRRLRRAELPAAPLLALGAGSTDVATRARLDAVERDVVGLLVQIASGLRANAEAVAARGSSSPALEKAKQTLVDVRARYEAHLADTLAASELVAIATWLRRMSMLASLPIVDGDQARAVMARFDQELASARAPSFVKRAQLRPGADATLALVVRESYPNLAIRAELAAVLPPRFAEPWTRAIESAATLRTTITDQLELVAVRAAADVAGQVHIIDNPDRPTLALTATASVVGSLESEVARLLDESERIRAESDAMREVEETLARG
jgi:hypothetical protein